MQFILNRERIDIENVNSDQTILRFLREEKQLTGTKEGCASGDCGACTVLIGTPKDEKIKYETVNSCIAPLGSLDGKHLITVEALSDDNSMHPAQISMVNTHGSQCGFCTPGFVMSLAGFYEENKLSIEDQVDRLSICEAISGNLCRCTGYKPIIDAGISMFSIDTPTSSTDKPFYTQEIYKKLVAIQPNTASLNYFTPQSQNELNELINHHPDAKLIAGGTDLMLENTQRYIKQPSFIDITRVKEMINIEEDDKYFHIGAATPYSTVETWAENHFPELNKLLKRLGSRQIRNRGTIGGNIGNASPIADMPPALIAVKASLSIIDTSANQKYIPIEEFYIDYKKTILKQNEYVAAIRIEKSYLSHFHCFYKLSKRMEDDISSVMMAVSFIVENNTIDACRLAYGGVAAIPIRVQEIEALFKGVSLSTAFNKRIEEKLFDILNPISDVRASAGYRKTMAVNLLKKAYGNLIGDEIPELTAGPSGAICA